MSSINKQNITAIQSWSGFRTYKQHGTKSLYTVDGAFALTYTDADKQHCRIDVTLILVSYRTVVGFFDYNTLLWRLTADKYSPTTSKQLTYFRQIKAIGQEVTDIRRKGAV